MFGDLVRSRSVRRLILALGEEVYWASQFEKVQLEPLGGGLNVERFVRPRGYPAPLKHLLIRIIGHHHRNTVSSMQASLEAGRKTEVDLINGMIAEKTRKAGGEAPVNAAVTEIVHDLESGILQPGNHLLQRLLDL